MAGLVIIGLVLSVAITKNAGQKKASVLAFLSLALIILAFYLVVIKESMQMLAPFFAAACVLVPLIVYLIGTAISRALNKKKSTEKRQPIHGKAARPKVKQPEKDVRSAASEANSGIQNEITVTAVEESSSSAEPKIEREPVVEPKPAPAPEPIIAPAPEPKPVIIPEPVVAPEPIIAFEPKPAPAPEPIVAPAPEPEPIIVYEPALEPELEPIVVYELEPEPEYVVVPTPVHTKATYEAVHEKAERFKQKGLHAVAARMYEECAVASDNPTEKKKALFDAMVSYVKAGKPEEAKQTAQTIRAAENLSEIENLKVDAVLRMS